MSVQISAVLQAILTAIPTAKEVPEIIANIPGFVHKRAEAEINGIRGFLIWDYLIYNEIFFEVVGGNTLVFFTSMSDNETEARWKELVEKYGV